MAGEHHEPDAIHHVLDNKKWDFFTQLFGDPVTWELPQFELAIGNYQFTFQLTKYMVLEVVAALLILLIFVPIARKSAQGALPRGRFWNAFESLLTFIRDQVARPNLGKEVGDQLTPFLWTLFLFILFNNLLGMIPMLGSPTASLSATLALAAVSFILMHGVAISKGGFIHYMQALWPKIEIDMPYVGGLLGFGLSAFIFAIELFGTIIKSGVLAVRLFANMFAGHVVLAMILIFIYQAQKLGPWGWGAVTLASVLATSALSLLELFVGFLQAYVFTFLTALFIGMSLHHGGSHDEEHGQAPEAAHGHAH